MPPVDLRPSQIEVNAIKQQLKLLGHTLPTDVIVSFLQENSGLLTAYQPPGSSAQQSFDRLHDNPPADTRQRGHLAGAEPGFASRVVRPVTLEATQTVPELDGLASSGQASYNDSFTVASSEAQQAGRVRKDVYDQRLCSRDQMSNVPGNTPDMAFSQGPDNSRALEDDFYSLKAELDELAAALHRPEHCSISQSRPDTSMQRMQPQGLSNSLNTQPHAMVQGEPFSRSSRLWWNQTTEPLSDRCNEPLQHAQHAQHAQQSGIDQAGRAPHEDVHDITAGMYQQQEGHSRPDLTAPYAQLRNCREHNHTDSVGVGQGPKRGNRGGQSPSPGSVLGCSSVRSLPLLNNSFIVPAQPVKPKKVDRVMRYRELQQVWNKDAFLRSGGTAKASKRQGEKFNELYAACHAAEDKLKDLTLKHGKAVKGVTRSRAQQENVAPTEKRRDALRWETRMRMQLRDDHF